MERNRRANVVLGTLAVLLLCGVVVSFALGRYPLSIREAGGILLSKLFSIEPFWEARMEMVLLNVRLPRILLACLVGCGLSAAGSAYQGIFQNPMASPDILGASSGAGFGAALAILLGLGSQWITAGAFFFGLLTVALVWLVGSKAKGNRTVGLVLAGVMVGSLFTAGTSLVKLVADPLNQLPAITYWLMGSLSGARMQDVLFVLLPMALGLVPLFLLRWRINILTLGDEEARSMGVHAGALRLVVVVCATLVTASAVSVSGTVGWVGLVIPHLCRRLVGNDYRKLLPASMLLGALFLLIVDDISRNLLATEIPLGILTAFVGAPFFLYLMLRKGEGLA